MLVQGKLSCRAQSNGAYFILVPQSFATLWPRLGMPAVPAGRTSGPVEAPNGMYTFQPWQKVHRVSLNAAMRFMDRKLCVFELCGGVRPAVVCVSERWL